LLAGVVEKFHYLKIGLAIVLTFIGVKMLVVALGIHIPIWISLIFVAVVLLASVAASLIWLKSAGLKIEVDLPEGFDSPFEDEAADAVDRLDGSGTREPYEQRHEKLLAEADSQKETPENIKGR
jgi:uncharacterized protein (DUF58 family)